MYYWYLHIPEKAKPKAFRLSNDAWLEMSRGSWHDLLHVFSFLYFHCLSVCLPVQKFMLRNAFVCKYMRCLYFWIPGVGCYFYRKQIFILQNIRIYYKQQNIEFWEVADFRYFIKIDIRLKKKKISHTRMAPLNEATCNVLYMDKLWNS